MRVLEDQARSTTPAGRLEGWLEPVRIAYFSILVALVLGSALASFVRSDGSPLANVSFWLCAVTFAISIASIRAGLLAAVLLVTVSPSLHQQLGAVLGLKLHAWTAPGVDCGIGLVAAWVLRGGLSTVRPILQAPPAAAVLALHLWIACSASVAVLRNLWQSASEFSLRGLASYAWMVRRIGLLDDYLPLQDLYFYSVATVLLFCTCSVVAREGGRLVRALAGAVLLGGVANAAFAAWQRATGKGWAVGDLKIEVNAFWPDIHSFGPFMATAILLGVGLLVSRKGSLAQRAAVAVAIGISAIGLYLSGSRSTLLILSLVLAGGALWAALALRGRKRIVPLAVASLVLFGVGLLFVRGYRGVSVASMGAALDVLNFQSLNVALSHRPEIWTAAAKMYSGFPLFGLGQGAFVRLSSIAQFSESGTLERLGGGGAHNYFLQSFVELGPVGSGLFALVLVPVARLGRDNLRLVSFYGLVGIAIGNLYAHSLLVREMLMLAAIFAGAYLWEAKTLAPARWRPVGARGIRAATVALLALALAAFVEVAFSFGRYPFVYGLRCQEARPLTWDHWTQGTLRVPVPPESSIVQMVLHADRLDLERRPLDVALAIVDQDGQRRLERTETFDLKDRGPRSISLEVDAQASSKLLLEVRPSHCYVPLNLGRGHDGRHLGVRVEALEFLPSGRDGPGVAR